VHLTANPVDWYAARAGGVIAYLLLSGGVLLGLTMARKRAFERWPRFALEDVHRFLGLLTGAFVAIHVGTIAVDSYLPFSPAQLTVPLLSTYRPVWTALGIVAAELLLALAVTNHYRDRLPYRFWRRAHYLNFAVWGAATMHGLGSGTDRSAPWLVAVYAVAVAAVAWALAARIVPRRSLGPAAAAAGALLVAGLALGPLHANPRPWNAVDFRDTLTGRIEQQLGPTRGLLSLVGDGRGRQRVLVRADLLIDTRRLETTAFQMELLPSGAVCRGSVTRVEDFGLEAHCTTPDGVGRVVRASWQPRDSAELVGAIVSRRAGGSARRSRS